MSQMDPDPSTVIDQVVARATAPPSDKPGDSGAATEHDALSLRLVDAAIDCIDQVGYGRVSTAEVGLRAGVSQGQQYERYPTKADLMAAVGAEVVRRWQATQDHHQDEAIDLTENARAAWLALVPRCLARQLSTERHVWQELILAAVTDESLRALLEPIGRGIAALAIGELEGLPGADLVPHDVRVGVGITMTQMSDLDANYLDLSGDKIPGLATALQLMVGKLYDDYVAGADGVEVAAG